MAVNNLPGSRCTDTGVLLAFKRNGRHRDQLTSHMIMRCLLHSWLIYPSVCWSIHAPLFRAVSRRLSESEDTPSQHETKHAAPKDSSAPRVLLSPDRETNHIVLPPAHISSRPTIPIPWRDTLSL